MDNGLQNSVARVLGDANPDLPAGTAFLFATSNGEQLWMTCHHVVRVLASLKLAVFANGTLTELACDYCPELSSPSADIAVLKTTLEHNAVSSLGLHKLPFGDLSSFQPEDFGRWSLLGCGMQEEVKEYRRGVPFDGTFSVYQSEVTDEPDDAALSKKILALGNSWNQPLTMRAMKLYEFLNESKRIEHCFSGSPICVKPRSVHEMPMCVGMLTAMRTKSGVVSGFAIPFEVIHSSCPRNLPFNKFASCVVVVLAAKREEFETVRSELSEEVLNRLHNYHSVSRDEWHPFKPTDSAIRGLFHQLSRELPDLPSWQLASDYIDSGDETFRQYLKERHLGPLLYVVDPCSTDIAAIRAIAEHVSNAGRDAHYIYALCSTIGRDVREELKNTALRDYLGGQFWQHPHSQRLEPAEDPYAFANRVREAMRKTCEQFLRQNPTAGKNFESRGHFFDWSGGNK